ncbi:MAG: demethylmenaquinone methyltransferase / 2-methoxy-6-polyprenyl,4-benzoquinol methylase [Humisphaera sp.]|nr:demethylmenaquinone methyltransferase / 2-methoxy-6-polyprenyl,4-benzoquinol methylase [Humisphaera sp.]
MRILSFAMDRTLAPHPDLPRYYDVDEGKRPFVRKIFDETAGDYDHVERLMAFGSGSWYRRKALERAGLARGMHVLDVAVGTGLVAREEVQITGDPKLVLGVDPSIGMISEARKTLPIRLTRGVAEELPLAGESFDFLSMGYALRHLSDLAPAFGEFHRVLKPGGRICVLEITRPRTRVHLAIMKAYMRFVVPALTRLTTRRPDTQLLWQYYWDTIEQCVPAERIMGALRAAGFKDVKHHLELGMFSEYTARKSAETGATSPAPIRSRSSA